MRFTTVSPPPNPSRSTGEAASGGMRHQQAITTPSTTCSDGAFILHQRHRETVVPYDSGDLLHQPSLPVRRAPLTNPRRRR